MKKTEFNALMKTHGIKPSKTRDALQLVLVDGITAHAASEQIDLARSVISRALAKVERPLCAHCGQPMP